MTDTEGFSGLYYYNGMMMAGDYIIGGGGLGLKPRTMPSRDFLIRQACLNILALDMRPDYDIHDLRKYAQFRFGEPLRRDWARLTEFSAMVRAEFYKLASRFEA